MRAIRLIAAVDQYDVSPGLMVKGTPMTEDVMVDRTNGQLVAHDVVEHQNGIGNIGSVWDELEALGGIWHARGRWGELGRDTIHAPEVHVASDLTRMFPEWRAEYVPPQHKLPRYTRSTDYDEDFASIIALSRADIPREHFDREEPGDQRDDLDRYLVEALHRMRIGFRKAERRFRHDNSFHSNNVFNRIAEAVYHAIRTVDYEGQEFILRYGGSEAVCRAVDPE